MPYDLSGKRVYVAGHNGMVGAALVRRLGHIDCEIVLPSERIDLRSQSATRAALQRLKPDVVIVAAAKVGGILANANRPAEFLYDNLMIEANLIHGAYEMSVEKLLFLGSSCIYPKHAPQPMAEDTLLTGPLEPTNEWYAIAKIAGIKLCQAYRAQHDADFISAMPTNLYGPGDTYDLEASHVLPALLRKAHEAKATGADSLTIWGSGEPLREFMHVDDLADACVFLLQNYSAADPINVGTGEEITIANLARFIMRTVGFEGELRLDRSKPDGTPRKLMDSSRLHALGWTPRITLDEGIASAYADFQNRHR